MKHKSLEFIPLEAGLRSDAGSKVLYGAQVAMLGEAKGHGFELDSTSLDQIVALGNAQPKGVRVRFGHPSLCTPALGTYLGVRKNFTRDGKYVRADLYMSEAADPAKAKHVLDMAEHAPDHIGNSVVVSGDLVDQLDENGKPAKDADGNALMQVLRVTALEAVDVVDQPAAGDGMFAEPIDGVELSPRVIVELRNAMDKPGFLDRVRSFLGVQDSPAPTTADSDVSVEDVSMTLTLSELLEKHPEVAAEHAAALSAEKDKELAAATEAGSIAERNRIVSFLSQCGPCHFAKTAEHPKGFVLHAIENGLSEVECLKGIIGLNAKAGVMSLLESESSAIPVGSADLTEQQLTQKQVAALNLQNAVNRILKKGGE